MICLYLFYIFFPDIFYMYGAIPGSYLNSTSCENNRSARDNYVSFYLFYFQPIRLLSMSPNARMERIASLENMLSMSSNALMAMASQLSEAEERECGLVGRGRWNQVRSITDAKNLLQYLFNATAESRCITALQTRI